MTAVLSNVVRLDDWYRVPTRYHTGGKTNPLREYQLPFEEYRLLQRVRDRLGGKLNPHAIVLESFLCGAIERLDLPEAIRTILDETAHESRVVLPK